jgi:GntR family transcriptional regulator
MQRALRVDPRDATPIWRQIEEGIRRLVASGALAPGSGVPSVRELAADLRVNPATVAKAYQRLSEAGVLAVRRGEGTFVAANPPALSRGERSRELADGAVRYASLAVTLGAGRENALDEVRAAFRRLAPTRKGDEP